MSDAELNSVIQPPGDNASVGELNSWADSAAAKVQLLASAIAWSFEWCCQVVGMLSDEELTVGGNKVYYPLLRAATRA